MENKPTLKIDDFGTKKWCLNGKLHREDGPAVEMVDGSYIWYKNGNRHREDGPAVSYIDGRIYWYKHGKLHRLDGPAVILGDNRKYWRINGKSVTDELTQWAKQNDIYLDNLTEVDKALIKII